jgi:superkiller protein 3
MGDTEELLKLFQEALGSLCEEGIQGQVAVMLAKTLWVFGSEEGMETAKAQLLDGEI